MFAFFAFLRGWFVSIFGIGIVGVGLGGIGYRLGWGIFGGGGCFGFFGRWGGSGVGFFFGIRVVAAKTWAFVVLCNTDKLKQSNERLKRVILGGMFI